MNLELIDLPVVKRKNIDGKRLYVRDGESVGHPSVTTITSTEKKSRKALHEWRKRVGPEEANRVARQASARGTACHKLIEDYILGQELDKRNPFQYEMFLRLKSVADDHIGKVLCIEGKMVSDHLRVGGTVDLIGEFNGRISVVDWKTARRKKTPDKIETYFMQKSAYAVMFEENTGIPVDRLVTVITTEDGHCQVFVRRRDDWIHKFIELRNAYNG